MLELFHISGLNLSSDPELGDNFSTMIDEDELVGQIQEQFSNVIHGGYWGWRDGAGGCGCGGNYNNIIMLY